MLSVFFVSSYFDHDAFYESHSARTGRPCFLFSDQTINVCFSILFWTFIGPY